MPSCKNELENIITRSFYFLTVLFIPIGLACTEIVKHGNGNRPISDPLPCRLETQVPIELLHSRWLPITSAITMKEIMHRITSAFVTLTPSPARVQSTLILASEQTADKGALIRDAVLARVQHTH